MARARRRPGGRRGATLLLGATVLAGLGGAAVFTYFADQGLPFQDRTRVTAAFDDVGSLRAGDDVRIASARVGTVREVAYRDGQAVAVLEIDGDRPVYRDATVTTASVGARSALGQKIVDLNPGSPGAGEVGPGDVLTQRTTRGAEEVSDLFAIFDEDTLRGMGITLQQVGGGLAGHGADVHDALAAAPEAVPALGEVSRVLSAEDGTDLVAMLRAADRLAGRFTGREDEIAALLSDMRTTLAAFTVDGAEPLSQTLERAPGALRDTRDALDSLDLPLADTSAAMTELRTGAEALGAATPDLRGLLRDGVGPLRDVPDVMDAAEPAVKDLTVTMADLRPLAPRLARTVDLTAEPLAYLAPYAPEIAQFFTGMRSALADGDAAGHWLRVLPMFSSESFSGAGVPLEDPTVARSAYPKPGQAERATKATPLSGSNR